MHECAAGRTRNRLLDGLSAPSHYAGAFSSPSRAFAGHVSFHTAAARGVLSIRSPGFYQGVKLNGYSGREMVSMASTNVLC
jgi:hypothetical protein